MADLITIATNTVLTQFLPSDAKNLGEVALGRVKQIGTKAAGYLTAVGRATQPIKEKILLPLMQAASLEGDPTLADQWAALLANAADPEAKVSVEVKFVEILRALNLAEIKVLRYLGERKESNKFTTSLLFGSLATHLGMNEQEFEIAADGLLSSRLCELPADEFKINDSGNLIRRISGKDELELSALGKAFLTAVTPPAS